MVKKISCKKRQEGSVLLEAIIAILIFSFALIGLARIQAETIKNNYYNTLRAEAQSYMSIKSGMMWGKAKELGSFVVEDEDIDESLTNLPDAKETVTVDGKIVTIEITWSDKDSGGRSRASSKFIVDDNS